MLKVLLHAFVLKITFSLFMVVENGFVYITPLVFTKHNDVHVVTNFW